MDKVRVKCAHCKHQIELEVHEVDLGRIKNYLEMTDFFEIHHDSTCRMQRRLESMYFYFNVELIHEDYVSYQSIFYYQFLGQLVVYRKLQEIFVYKTRHETRKT